MAWRECSGQPTASTFQRWEARIVVAGCPGSCTSAETPGGKVRATSIVPFFSLVHLAVILPAGDGIVEVPRVPSKTGAKRTDFQAGAVCVRPPIVCMR